jgi:hypothetical protein
MAKHHTRNTVSVTKWCNKCARMTPHAVMDKREAHCLDCADRAAGKVTEPRKGGKVLLKMPCTCYRYPFAHFHVETDPLWSQHA